MLLYKNLTPEKIEQRIALIAASTDDEKQHSQEDDLYEVVLRAIVAGAENPKALAKAALKTKKMDFARWCA